MRDLKGSRAWLEKAIRIADSNDVKLLALEDPDLEPLWKDIGTI
jgi:hypothetical protein